MIKEPIFKSDGKVIPVSKLAEAKNLELQRSRDLESSIEDEERHRGSNQSTIRQANKSATNK